MFKIELVQVSFLDEQSGGWHFAGRLCKGVKFHYEVLDGNYRMRNRWEFLVQVPNDWTKGNYILVRPVAVPNRNMWAGLDRRTISFQRATLGRHLAKVYAKLAVSDVQGKKTRQVLTKDSKKSMPTWLNEFHPVQKQRVTKSAANDGEHLVAVVERDDHIRMIKLFMALKPWVLDRKYDPREAREAASRRRTRDKRAQLARSLKGKLVAVTGRLGYGTRIEVGRWLSRLGARLDGHATSKTDLLIVGAHPYGEDRLKIQKAKKLGIPMLTEARFRNRYSV